ncbi:MAG TPA: tRNA epoxyqueuosine(34) reductase QueG [Longimicrobiales bacterium]|nr:tRNA epoxyqueuosine(34) reductase QueG [Longimicrobiales bacterium]
MPREHTISERIRAEALRLGFQRVGFTPLRTSDHAVFYRAWLERGLHGSMDYLARPDSAAARMDPAVRWPALRSAVVVAESYATSTSTSGGGGVGVIARYARGRDYHRVLKKKLMALLRFVEAETGRALPLARAYVDTGPVLERELARRAGIGWFGRNTMLIDPQAGSYFFLGSLLVPLELEYDEPFEADRCGTCTACVDTCPTGALLGRDANGAPVMDATRCISYLTIENRGEIPRALRPAIGNRIYGCDICQEVCPWNSPRLVQITEETDYLPRVPPDSATGPGRTGSGSGTHPHPHAPRGPSTDSPSLVELMRMTREDWDAFSRGSAIRRAGYEGFKRNVAVAMGNWLVDMQDEPPEEAVAVLREALEDEEPLVREHAAWALGRADSA